MPSTYCPSCHAKNDYRGIKPAKCQFCSEPLEKRFVPKQAEVEYVERPVRTIKQRRTARRLGEPVEAEQYDDSPIDLDLNDISIKAEGEGTPKMTIGSVRKDRPSVERQSEGGGVEGLKSLSTFKQEVLANMLKPVTR